jgi:hypothetical protein
MRILDMVLLAFVKAKTLKVIRNEDAVYLSNGDGFPLNLLSGRIERVETDVLPRLERGWM